MTPMGERGAWRFEDRVRVVLLAVPAIVLALVALPLTLLVLGVWCVGLLLRNGRADARPPSSPRPPDAAAALAGAPAA